MSRSKCDELSQFFRQIVGDIADELEPAGVKDEVMWSLSRRLHTTWREAIRTSIEDGETDLGGGKAGHPAMTELLRLVNLEVEP